MCAKPPKPKKVKEKPVQYLRNPFLDGINIGRDTGRASLRIDLGQQAASPAPAPTSSTSRALPLPFESGLLIPSRGGKRVSQMAGFRAF